MDLTDLRQRVIRETRVLPMLPSIEDIDDALNMVQRTYIQPIAKVECTSTYTTTESDHLEFVKITDMYQLRFVQDETAGTPGFSVTILNQDETSGMEGDRSQGIRLHSDTFYIQNYDAGTKFKFYYYSRLKDLGTGTAETTVPEINEQWHDLYWLGAASWLYPQNQMLLNSFYQRLDAFRADRLKRGRGDRRTQRAVKIWY